jgi:hypothetical protein
MGAGAAARLAVVRRPRQALLWPYQPDSARIAVASVRASLVNLPVPQVVIFCCFSEADLQIYQDALNEPAV